MAPGYGDGAGADPRLGLADALLADDEAWVVCRPVREDGRIGDFEYLLANPAAERSTGLGPMVGRRMRELVPEVDRGVFQLFCDVVETGGRRRSVAPSLVRDGHSWSPGWTEVDVRAVGDVVVAHWRDVTEHRHEAMAAAQGDARLRALLANAGEVISVFAPDGRTVLYQSPSYDHVLGRPAPEAGMASLVHPEDRDEALQMFAQLVEEGPGAVVEGECRLQHGDGRWLWAHIRGSNHVDDPDVRGIVLNIWDVSEQRALADQLRLQALHDPLTGLPNRRLVDEVLQRALARTGRTPGRVGLVLCDVDWFKSVNDALGHPAGDELLVQVADRLRALVRPSDTVGRLGGDEFVVVCEDLHEPAELRTLVQRLHAALRGVYRVAGHELPVSVTLGASCSGVGVTPSALLSEADTALYEAKRAGRDRSQVFDRRSHRRNRERAMRQGALRAAIDTGQLVLHYQPKVDLSTGEAVAAEALVRWQHPTDGLLLPGSFLPLAEESLLVVDLGECVLRAAMVEAAGWRWSGHASATPTAPMVNINVSGRHLSHPSFLEHLDRALEVSGIDPAQIELELTETVLLHDLEMTGRVLAGVRERGVMIALDDFGTGYSSLTWLQRLPVDTVKLDRSFVADLLAAQGGGPDIVGSVTSLAHALGKLVVAEGVETPEQHDLVVALGCDLAQGYLYGRPEPAAPFPRGGPVARQVAAAADDASTA